MKHIMQSQAMKKFIRNKRAMTGLAVVALLTLSVLLLPLVLDLEPYTTDREAGFNQPPSAAHIFGTDDVGRDLFARVLYGGRTSLFVGITATIISVLIGIPLGIACAVKQYSLLDTIPSVLSFFIAAIPSFVLGMVLLLVFAQQLKILPSYGLDTWRHYIMPILAIAIPPAAQNMRFTKSSMLEAIRQDYVRTARGKGATEARVIWGHAIKNAMLPVITSLGMSFGSMLGGTIVIEQVFGMSGLGSLVITAITTKDIPQTMAVTIFLAAMFCVIMLVVDLLYAFIDPRVKARYTQGR